MARVFNGTTQYLSGSSTLLSNEPIDMFAYQNSDTVTQYNTVVMLGNSGSANGAYGLFAGGSVAGDPFDSVKQDDSAVATGTARTASAFLAATWYTISGTFISNTSRAVFMNGANKATNATSTNDPTPDYISIGAFKTNAVSSYMDGNISEVLVLDANCTDEVHASFGLGYSPIWSMPISNVRGWYPLQADNNNRMAGGYPDLAATGSPTDVIHPFNVVYPSINGLITM